MKIFRVFLVAGLLVIAGNPGLLQAGENLVVLDLSGREPGPVQAAAMESLPLAMPNRVTVADPNMVTVEEHFDNGSREFEGPVLVLRKEQEDGECVVDFVFSPPGGIACPDALVLEAELIFASADQAGNASLHFRNASNDLLYYLQIGATGGFAEVVGRNEPRRGTERIPFDEPVKLRVELDFRAGTARLQVGSEAPGEHLPLKRAENFSGVGFKIAGSRRAFAIRSLTLTAQ